MVKTALFGVVIGGVILLGFALMNHQRSKEEGSYSPPRIKKLSTEPLDQDVLGQSLSSSPSSVPAPTEPLPAKDKPVKLPRELIGNSAAMKSWLLELPDHQFKPLVGSDQLDSYVAQIFGDLQGGEEQTLSDFLVAINAKIERASQE